jgi:hypothetical protein
VTRRKRTSGTSSNRTSGSGQGDGTSNGGLAAPNFGPQGRVRNHGRAQSANPERTRSRSPARTSTGAPIRGLRAFSDGTPARPRDGPGSTRVGSLKHIRVSEREAAATGKRLPYAHAIRDHVSPSRSR